MHLNSKTPIVSERTSFCSSMCLFLKIENCKLKICKHFKLSPIRCKVCIANDEYQFFIINNY